MNSSAITYRTAIILTATFLTCLGLLAIYASSSVPAAQKTGNEFYYLEKQIATAVLGFIIIFMTGHISFRWIERATLPLLVLTFVLLGLIHLPQFQGSAKGAARWLLIAGISIQPGELAKLAMVMFLAKNLSRPRCDLYAFWSGIFPNLIVFAAFAGLLMLQPDFGTAALLTILVFLMMFVAGLPRAYVIGSFIVCAAGFVFAILSAPYRLKRLLAFLDPWAEVQGSGFQIIQSYLGFQNGGLFGAGLGESRQKLFFLPEAHTDFILAVIGEELGLLGVSLICCLFGYFVYLGYQITLQQKDSYRKFLAFGITSLITLQAALNMGVTMGMLPTKGMTLPFVSNGANSLVVFLVATAILARISQEAPARSHGNLKSI